MLNFMFDELRLIAENRNIDRCNSIFKNQFINLFNTPTTSRSLVENTPVQQPMKPEDDLALEKVRRGLSQIERRSKRKIRKHLLVIRDIFLNRRMKIIINHIKCKLDLKIIMLNI